jgi:hypothetical protein
MLCRLQRFETAYPNHFCNVLALLLRAIQKEQQRDRLRAFVSPRGARTVLHDDVAPIEMNGFGVIKLQPNLAFIVDGSSCALRDLLFQSDRLTLSGESQPRCELLHRQTPRFAKTEAGGNVTK